MGTPYSYPSGPADCEGLHNCPLVNDLSHPALVSLYCFWGASILCFIVHFGTRRKAHGEFTISSGGPLDIDSSLAPMGSAKQEMVPLHRGLSEVESSAPQADGLFAENDLIQLGFKRSSFGTVCMQLWNTISLVFIGMFLLLIIDYYFDCQMKGIDALCFYGSHPLFGSYQRNSEYFVFTWFCTLFWFGFNLNYKDQIPVWFMLPCAMREAEVVYLWTWNKQVPAGTGMGKTHLFVRALRRLRTSCTSRHLKNGHECLLAVEKSDDGTPYFVFEANRYLFNSKSNRYEVPCNGIKGKSFADFHAEAATGLEEAVATLRQNRFGANKIAFERRSVLRLFRDEVMTYFYFYQFMMYVVWFWFSYLFVASVEFLVVLGSATVSTYLQWNGERTIASLTNYVTSVRVRRGGKIVTISSNDIVPRDVVLLTEIDWIVPCDMIVVSGTCIMDESGLTGESMPVQKKACSNDPSVLFDPKSSHVVQHTLYAGTIVLQLTGETAGNDPTCEREPGEGIDVVEAYVTATASSTSKGELVSAILFPEELKFQYEEELEVVICMLLLYGIVAFIIVVHFITRNGSDSSWVTKWAYGIFTASQIFSPLLPVALKIGQIRSSQRLHQKGVFCTSPRHIAICGKISVFCFDKTGTLTKEGMDFSGAVPVEVDAQVDGGKPFLSGLVSNIKGHAHMQGKEMPPIAAKFSIPNSNSIIHSPIIHNSRLFGGANEEDRFIPDLIVEAMATCHSVALYGEDRFVGNEVEVKMFSATGWSLEKTYTGSGSRKKGVAVVVSPNRQTSYKILRRYEFDHGRQCMSVIVEKEQTGIKYIITKGSFEKMAVLCDPRSVPADFVAEGKENAMQGGYVLGIARREFLDLDGVAGDPEALQSKLESLSRDAVETPHTLQLMSLLIFRNEPKHDSRDAILHLRSGCVRPVMITGDNAQCGQYISRSCELMNPESHILLAEVSKTTKKVSWTFIGGEGAALVTSTHSVAGRHSEGRKSREFAKSASKTTAEVLAMVEGGKLRAVDDRHIELAVTGNDTLQLLEDEGALMLLLTHIRMFARMSPENKSVIVRKFKDAGFTVGMCGDGGNDCGALRAAHAGIALSDAEASVVSPFTSRTRSPESVVDLLKEGRASLATSFANYKFLITYGLSFSIVKFCSFYYGVLMSNMAYYFIDGVALTTLCYTMTLSSPLDRLARERPSASLLGASAVASTLGVNIILFVCLVSALLMMEGDPDYVPWPSEYSAGGDWWYISDNWESTVLYVVMYFFLLSSAMIYSFGYKFRKSVCDNMILVSNISVLFVMTTFLVLLDASRFTNYWHMASYQFNSENSVSPVWREYQRRGGEPSPAMSIDFRFKLYFLVMGFIVLAAFWQAEVMEGSIGEFLKNRFREDSEPRRLRF